MNKAIVVLIQAALCLCQAKAAIPEEELSTYQKGTGIGPANLLSKKAGAKIVSYSSNYGGAWDVENLIAGKEFGTKEELPVWCTDTDEPFPHWVVIELPDTLWITTLIFNNYLPDEPSYPGISAKNIQIQVSKQSAVEGFRTVASFELERNKNNQEVRIEPTEARWVKIIITSNYGNPHWTELGQLGAYDDGSRPIEIASVLKTHGFADLYGIYFDFASSNLRTESAPVLGEIAKALKENPSWKLVIEGHTDNIGDEKSNQMLSEKRAQAVQEALVQLGVDVARLTAQGFGESKPVADNNTAIGRALNRRVTLRIVEQ